MSTHIQNVSNVMLKGLADADKVVDDTVHDVLKANTKRRQVMMEDTTKMIDVFYTFTETAFKAQHDVLKAMKEDIQQSVAAYALKMVSTESDKREKETELVNKIQTTLGDLKNKTDTCLKPEELHKLRQTQQNLNQVLNLKEPDTEVVQKNTFWPEDDYRETVSDDLKALRIRLTNMKNRLTASVEAIPAKDNIENDIGKAVDKRRAEAEEEAAKKKEGRNVFEALRKTSSTAHFRVAPQTEYDLVPSKSNLYMAFSDGERLMKLEHSDLIKILEEADREAQRKAFPTPQPGTSFGRTLATPSGSGTSFTPPSGSPTPSDTPKTTPAETSFFTPQRKPSSEAASTSKTTPGEPFRTPKTPSDISFTGFFQVSVPEATNPIEHVMRRRIPKTVSSDTGETVAIDFKDIGIFIRENRTEIYKYNFVLCDPDGKDNPQNFKVFQLVEIRYPDNYLHVVLDCNNKPRKVTNKKQLKYIAKVYGYTIKRFVSKTETPSTTPQLPKKKHRERTSSVESSGSSSTLERKEEDMDIPEVETPKASSRSSSRDAPAKRKATHSSSDEEGNSSSRKSSRSPKRSKRSSTTPKDPKTQEKHRSRSSSPPAKRSTDPKTQEKPPSRSRDSSPKRSRSKTTEKPRDKTPQKRPASTPATPTATKPTAQEDVGHGSFAHQMGMTPELAVDERIQAKKGKRQFRSCAARPKTPLPKKTQEKPKKAVTPHLFSSSDEAPTPPRPMPSFPSSDEAPTPRKHHPFSDSSISDIIEISSDDVEYVSSHEEQEEEEEEEEEQVFISDDDDSDDLILTERIAAEQAAAQTQDSDEPESKSKNKNPRPLPDSPDNPKDVLAWYEITYERLNTHLCLDPPFEAHALEGERYEERSKVKTITFTERQINVLEGKIANMNFVTSSKSAPVTETTEPKTDEEKEAIKPVPVEVPKQWTCYMCKSPRRFESLIALNTHKVQQHPEYALSHRCIYCAARIKTDSLPGKGNYATRLNAALKEHYATHFPVKPPKHFPYMCLICAREEKVHFFENVVGYKNHLASQHNVKMFYCPVCGLNKNTYSQKNHCEKNNLRMSKGILCALCNVDIQGNDPESLKQVAAYQKLDLQFANKFKHYVDKHPHLLFHNVRTQYRTQIKKYPHYNKDTRTATCEHCLTEPPFQTKENQLPRKNKTLDKASGDQLKELIQHMIDTKHSTVKIINFACDYMGATTGLMQTLGHVQEFVNDFQKLFEPLGQEDEEQQHSDDNW